MSFILNALKKSELERQVAQTGAVPDEVDEKVQEATKKKSRWVILLTLVNLIFLSGFIWFFMLREKPDENKAKEEVVAKVTKDRVTKKQVKPEKKEAQLVISEKVVTPKIIKQKIIKPKEEIKKVEEVKSRGINQLAVNNKNNEINTIRESQQVSIAQQLEKQRLKRIKKRQKNLQAIQRKPFQAVKKSKPQPIIEKRKIIQPVAIPKQEEPVYRRNNPPYLSGMSYDFRRSVPDIRINVFVYTENAANRMIMIDMKRYQVGEEIAEGMELNEIRKNSIVVEFKDEVFQIKR
jgi:general secretion pathway protein B